MAKLLVFSGPVSAEQEDEYNRWYDEVHIPEVCGVEGITGAQRFAASALQPFGEPVAPYVAVYELGADPKSALEAMAVASATFDMSEAIDLASTVAFVVEDHGEPYEA